MHDVEVLQVRAQGEDLVARVMGIEAGGRRESAGATIHVRRAHFPALEKTSFIGSI